jgi:hypothetical protein
MPGGQFLARPVGEHPHRPRPDDPAMPADQRRRQSVDPADLTAVVPVACCLVAPREHSVDVDPSRNRLRGSGRSPRRRDEVDRAEYGLARHTGPIRALTAQQLGLDDGGAQATPDDPLHNVLAGRPSSNDHDVDDLLGIHVASGS